MKENTIPLKYKICLSNSDSIPLDTIEEVKITLTNMTKAGKGGIVITPHGIFNPSFYISIVEDKKRWKKEAEYYQLNQKLKEPEVSQFAKLIHDKMKMLSDKNRSLVQEEVSGEERRLKCK